MRFLQTEWHRHERDRNAWEIERQEMKSRIASLEGQARRADATQKALKKYVAILEKKVKEQAALLKSDGKADAVTRPDRAALLQEKLRREFPALNRFRAWLGGGSHVLTYFLCTCSVVGEA
jgi:striatin 1/3/4